MNDQLALTPIGKLVFTSILGWINNDSKLIWKVKGDPQVMKAMAEVVVASKKFFLELNREGATIDSVIAAMNDKAAKARQFQEVTGRPWPL